MPFCALGAEDALCAVGWLTGRGAFNYDLFLSCLYEKKYSWVSASVLAGPHERWACMYTDLYITLSEELLGLHFVD